MLEPLKRNKWVVAGVAGGILAGDKLHDLIGGVVPQNIVGAYTPVAVDLAIALLTLWLAGKKPTFAVPFASVFLTRAAKPLLAGFGL